MIDPAALSAARFPEVPGAGAHYESFYVKASDPERPRGVWIRYTVFKRPGEAPVGSVWCTLWPDGAAPAARKLTVAAADLGAGGDDYIRVAASRLAPGVVAGSAGDAGWDLRFADAAAPFAYLPRAWMYRARVPKTKALAMHPTATFRGRVQIGEEALEVDDWPGMVGHNWGTEHAERWVWLHAAGFAGAPDAWFDATIGRVRVGRAVLPWIANGCLCLDGERHRLGGPGRIRGTTVRAAPSECAFTLPGASAIVRGRAAAPLTAVAGWRYADPGGGEHLTANCSVARLRLEVDRPGQSAIGLEIPAGAAYELGAREEPAGVTIQPFPDP